MTSTRTSRTRTILVTITALGLFAAACGSDDDPAPSTATEPGRTEPSDEPDSTPASEADSPIDTSTELIGPTIYETPNGASDGVPRWLQTPSKVRASGLLDLPADGGLVGYGEGDTDCSVRAGVIAVYAGSLAADSALLPKDELLPLIEESEDLPLAEAQEIGIRYYGVEDGQEVSLSAVLRSMGVLASPVHEMFPAPGRMFFPGTLPVPTTGQVTIDLPDNDEIVTVIDTGGLNPSPHERVIVDDRHVDPVDRTDDQSFVAGHGTFVAGVILAQGSNSLVRHIRVPFTKEGEPPAPGVRFDENDFLLAFASSDTKLINLSAGFGACIDEDGRVDGDITPVVSIAIAAATLDAEKTLVAAAGNAGPGVDRLTYPAAFADPRSYPSLAPTEDSEDICLNNFDEPLCADLQVLVDEAAARLADPASTSQSIIAVEANDAASAGTDGPTDDELYSTTGDWTTVAADGCHDSWYPAGSVTYPAFESSDQSDDEPQAIGEFAAAEVQGGENRSVAGVSTARWCGSSFATAVVSGQLAEALAGDPNLTPQDRKNLL